MNGKDIEKKSHILKLYKFVTFSSDHFDTFTNYIKQIIEEDVSIMNYEKIKISSSFTELIINKTYILAYNSTESPYYKTFIELYNDEFLSSYIKKFINIIR